MAHFDGISLKNKKTQTGFKRGSINPMILASSGRTPLEIPSVNRMYASPIWKAPRKITAIISFVFGCGGLLTSKGNIISTASILP